MKQLLFVGAVLALVSFQCNSGSTQGGTGKKVKDAEAAVKKLQLNSMTVIPKADAVVMIKHALDSTLSRDYSLGKLSVEDIKALISIEGFKRMYFLRANYAKQGNMPTTMVALVYDVDSSTSDTDQASEQVVYGEIKICPPPDANYCLQKLGIKELTYP